MPLADHRCSIADLLKQLGKGLLIAVEAIAVRHKTVNVAVLAGLNHSATRPANRIRTEAVLKQHALSRQQVDVRSRIHILQPTVVSTDCVRRMIIAEDKQDVWTLVRGGFPHRLGRRSR